jgi:hypothetical protein
MPRRHFKLDTKGTVGTDAFSSSGVPLKTVISYQHVLRKVVENNVLSKYDEMHIYLLGSSILLYFRCILNSHSYRGISPLLLKKGMPSQSCDILFFHESPGIEGEERYSIILAALGN